MLLTASIVVIGLAIYGAFSFSADNGIARSNDFPNGFAYNPTKALDFDPAL